MSQDAINNNRRKPLLCVCWKRTFPRLSLSVKSQLNRIEVVTRPHWLNDWGFLFLLFFRAWGHDGSEDEGTWWGCPSCRPAGLGWGPRPASLRGPRISCPRDHVSWTTHLWKCKIFINKVLCWALSKGRFGSAWWKGLYARSSFFDDLQLC